MKQLLEDSLEQLTGKSSKPTSPPTQSLKEQLDVKKTINAAWNQILGGDGKSKTSQNLEQRQKEEASQNQAEIDKVRQNLEVKNTPKPLKGNTEVLRPPKPDSSPPAYITGKAGYDKEKEAARAAEKGKHRLPELAQPSSKPKRGSWLSAMERKKHGTEVKGGRE